MKNSVVIGLLLLRSLVILLPMCNLWLLYNQVNAVSLSSPDVNFKNPMRKWPVLAKLRSTTPDVTQAETVRKMLTRLLTTATNRSHDFVINVNSSLRVSGRDVFVLKSLPAINKLEITGSSGTAAACGFHYYMKTFCNCHFSWSGHQLETLPRKLPIIDNEIQIVFNDLFRYYQNVCTFSYSAVWWNWTRWEQELDWMALNGINLPLALTGQETIFRRIYLRLGFTQTDLDQFFAGPAFLAWSRMGNIDGWAGSLSEDWYDDQLRLQHRILRRMRRYGMLPVLPTFSGHVPPAVERRFANVSVTRLSDWGRFNSTYCCTYLLDHRDPLFRTIGTAIMNEIKTEFGLSHVYSCDTFNELQPPFTEPDVVSGIGRAVYESMVTVDPNAIWVMQGWLFLSASWNVTMSKALLTSVPNGRMVVLDLQSEIRPKYQLLESYYGQPWIWCMLLNFGGVKGLYGAVDNVIRGPFRARIFPNSTMIGTGLTPEGIESNDVMYELMNELSYLRQPIDVDTWFGNFAERRYAVGNANASSAWNTMARTVFNCTQPVGFHGRFIITRRPSFKLESVICYDPDSFLPAWDAMLAALNCNDTIRSSALFLHDLVDVTREVLIVYSVKIYSEMVESFKVRNPTDFNSSSQALLELLNDLEVLLASDRHFLLGSFLQAAKTKARSTSDSILYEYNARNQITLWGPNGEILDYATKQWSGIVSHYYIPRWAMFVADSLSCLRSNSTFNQTVYNEKVFEQVERPFTFDNLTFSTDPTGDPVDIVGRLHSKWRNRFGELRSTFQSIRRAKLSRKFRL